MKWFFLTWGFIFTAHVQAASNILVWPIYQFIEADQKGSILWLENRGDASVQLQLRAYRWQQHNNQNLYSDQKDIIISPPFIRIEQGQRQIIRILKQVDLPKDQQFAYRIVIDEIPQERNKIQTGINLQMRYVLPLFVNGSDILSNKKAPDLKLSVPPDITWRVEKESQKNLLTIYNNGKTHVRISNIFWGDDNKIENATLVFQKGLMGYVLSKSYQSWSFKQGQHAPTNKKLFIQFADNQSPLEVPKSQ